MSWAAHELESYFIQKHTKFKVSYLAILLGCLLPDLFTKLPVYGLHIGHWTFIKASVPYKYHRGWPGVGFTHSLMFGFLFALAILAWKKNRAWFVGLVLGSFAHVLTDVFDSVGTMVFFPFTTQHFSTDMWAYAAQAGRYGDAAAYYSSFGGVWDFFWLCMALTGFRVFSRDFFFGTVVPSDPVWGWMRRKYAMSDRAMLAAYRSYFVYGACRIFAWFGWARFLNPRRGIEKLDWHWGGPSWVQKVTDHAHSNGQFFANAIRGGLLWFLAIWLIWKLVGHRLWVRAA